MESLHLSLDVQTLSIYSFVLSRRPALIVILPVGEVRDEVLADLAGAVDPPVGVECFQSFRRSKGTSVIRKEHLALLLVLAGAEVGDFGLHPRAVHARLGED